MSPPFLCTTALKEFWNFNAEKILFLGSWCLRYDQRKDWENLDYQILPHPWDDREKMYKDAKLQKETYEELLKIFTEFLNDAHAEKHDNRYWRIIIGPWLIHYIQVLHERFLCLNYAFKIYPNLVTVGLSESSFKIARDSWDHVIGTTEDIYNLQIYTAITQALGYNFPKQNFDWDWPKKNNNRPLLRNKLRKIREAYFKLHCWWDKKAPTLIDVNIPWSKKIQLMSRTRFSSRWCHLPGSEDLMNITSPVSPHPHRPKLATLTLRNRTHFHEILIKTLPNFFPLILLENYHSCTAWLNLNWQGSLTKTLLTENSLIGNEAFKFLSAALSEKGSKLIAFQHGGSYGSARYNPLEDHEIQVSDEFWSWGWRRGQDHIKPMTSPKLSLLASKRRSLSPEDKNYILFVGNSYPRYHYRTWSYHIASQADEYIDWQIQFLNRIRKEIKNQLIYRPYPEDYGWCFINRFKDRCPDIHIDDRHFSYDVMMSKASLVICDMNVTTILESLAANIPTIVFWDPQRIELRAEAEPFFQFLRNVGILYNSPIAAAEAVNEKWPKLQGWWKQLDVWQARTEFVNQYAYNSPDWENDWWKFLKLEVESVVHSRPVQ